MDWNSFIITISVFTFATLEHQFPYVIYVSSLYQRTHTNLLLGFLNTSINHVTISVALNWVLQQTSGPELLALIPNSNLQLLLVLIILDLYLYFWHRMMHSWRWVWGFHYIHHTEHQVNTSTAYRFHPVEAIASNIPKLLLIWLLGIEINQLLAYELILAISLMFQHSNWSLPTPVEQILGYVFITPNIHRTHHAKNLQQSNSNFGSVFCIWDKFFNTFYHPWKLPPNEPEVIGKFSKLNIWQLLILPLVIQKR
ncbi:sterol desaturase family protein [Calothrix sp. NIES-3974]|uniref:sterol desaturase family protein n=1 Tax=Calothrix sp. NIES-3974 TaxID=2005462 RepID=UPI000B607C50|nr:sterol desaturase family protein [Calothrix sp. NIES-3974]BAZ04125.1 fatty acid hydroxylase [Calothrix sp. NIES-3974]